MSDEPPNRFRKHNVTTVILTYKELEHLEWLAEHLGLRRAQLIRMAINRLYEWEHEVNEQRRTVAAKVASTAALASVLRR